MVELLSSGYYTNIQDSGRFGFTNYGVPLSGAMDINLSKLANLLVGNNEDLPTLEMTFSGPKLMFQSASVIAVTAFKAKVFVNNIPVEVNRILMVKPNDRLHIKDIETCAYLAVSNGFNVGKKLCSSSQYKGITRQEKLTKGEIINCNKYEYQSFTKYASINYDFSFYNTHILEVYILPEFFSLNNEQKYQLNQKFTISSQSNRMAYQLNEKIKNHLKGIVSKPVLPGTVQLTPEGMLIILMRDAQVTGGYPRIFQLSESSINKLSQKPPNSKIEFKILNR